MVSESDLLRLALMAYEAGVAPELWENFLKAYAETISADASMLQVHDLSGHKSAILASFGIILPLKQSYNEYYSKLNLWRERGRSLYTAGRVNLDEEQCPRAELERSEFYNDCLKRFGVMYSMGAVIAREGWLAPTLSGLRGPGKHGFDETERQVAHFLLPHLSRAWAIAKHLDTLAAGESAMNALPLSVVLVEPGGTAIYCNRAAEEMLRSNDGLSLRGGMLSAADRQAEARLGKLIRGALSPHEANGAVAIAIPRPSLRREYQVTAAPLLGRSRPFTGVSSAMALVLINDPERQRPASRDALMQLYKLTRKEAALAAKLSEGKTVERAAEELSITYDTARTHLRRIFSKTGTSRQAELLLLIARLPVIADGGSGG